MRKYLTKKLIGKHILQKFNYPNDIDVEMVPMLDVMNSVPGVRTVFSCCGHGNGDWYLTMAFTSHPIFRDTVDFFKTGHSDIVVSDGVNEETFSHDLKFKYSVQDDGRSICWSLIPEEYLAIYCTEFDHRSDQEKCDEYRRICEFFARFLVRKYW